MLMSKDRRLQVLVETDQYRRLSAAADDRGVSVATVVREAIGHYLDAGPDQVRSAVDRVLNAPPMDVPDPDELREELSRLRGRRG
jgi:predicted DNA-binding protein